MIQLREVRYTDTMPEQGRFIIAGDLRKTKSNFGLFYVHDNTVVLLVSLHAHSTEITDFSQLVKTVLDTIKEYYGKDIKEACFGIPGVIVREGAYAEPTNVAFTVDIYEIKCVTGLTEVVLVNDFQAIGYGISDLDPRDIRTINQGQIEPHAPKVCVRAGTGLGGCISVWNREKQRVQVLPSQGGHTDCAAQSQEDLDLLDFVRAREKLSGAISWEHILSDAGIQRLYMFTRTLTMFPTQEADKLIEKAGFQPADIVRFQAKSTQAAHAFVLYAGLYARYVKTFALTVLARGGVYIAGDIAAKNPEIFQHSEFIDEFINCPKKAELLRAMPVFIITNDNASLYGAARYLVDYYPTD